MNAPYSIKKLAVSALSRGGGVSVQAVMRNGTPTGITLVELVQTATDGRREVVDFDGREYPSVDQAIEAYEQRRRARAI